MIPLGIVAVAASFLYGAYWAFAVRRALGIRLYKNQALGVGFVAVNATLIFVFFLLSVVYELPQLEGGGGPQNYGGHGLSAPYLLAWGASVFAIQFVLFYVIDASILRARTSDPLNRDTLEWSRLRAVLWPAIVVLNLLTFIYPSIPGPLFLIIVTGGGVLPVAARRSMDASFRRSLEWLALFVAAVFIGVGSIGEPSVTVSLDTLAIPLTITISIYLVGTYFLYRSARALVPLNRLSLDEADLAMSPTTSALPNTSRVGRSSTTGGIY